MYRPNFCAECGERLARGTGRTWRTPLQARAWCWCESCARRLGRSGFAGLVRALTLFSIAAVSAFSFGRYLRPPAPPLIISRAHSSPLSDLPVDSGEPARGAILKENDPARPEPARSQANDEKAYICGARTKKGTPCRRRVHMGGERCFQHKGMTAIVPLEKLEVKSK